MRSGKALLSILLIVLLICALVTPAVKADTEYFTAGDYYCTYNSTGITIDMYIGNEESSYIPDKIEGFAVTELGYTAFQGSDIKEVVIPASVQKVGARAFWGCSNLESVTLLSSDAEIVKNPFYNCPNLLRFVVSPDNPTYATINGILFNKAERKLICYPSGRTDEVYEVPSGIKIIGHGAFYGSSLKEILIPDSVEKFEDQVFNGCTKLEKTNLSDALIEIGSNPFFRCTSLSSVKLSDHHPIFTFDGQYLINKVTHTLISCLNVSDNGRMIVPSYIKVIGDLCFSTLPVKEIEFPSWLNRIGTYAFSQCTMLESVKIPEGITVIESSAFRGCSALTDVVLPNTLEAIHDYAFAYCPGLNSLIAPASVQEIDSSAFFCSDNLTLHVIAASYAEEFAQKNDIAYESTVMEDTSWLDADNSLFGVSQDETTDTNLKLFGTVLYLAQHEDGSCNLLNDTSQDYDKILIWDVESESYYDSSTECWIWYNTNVTPNVWQFWYEGISSEYNDGWMEYDVGEQHWYIEANHGNWIKLPAKYETDRLWYIAE